MLYCVRENRHPHVYLPLYLSIFLSNKIVCQRFLRTTACRILKFCTYIDYDLLYRVRENQHPHAYHSLYLSMFFSSKRFHTDFSAFVRASVFKFCTYLQKVKLYCVKENHYAEIYFAFFLLFPFSFFFHLSRQFNAQGNLCQRLFKNYCT